MQKNSSGIRSLVFDAIRSSKPLCTFLTNVISSLNVIVTSYNSGIRITLSWREMVAHLTGYRNPFVTVELKPKFLQPHEYIYEPDTTRLAFDGEEDGDPLAVQRSDVVMDGSSHPSFDANFKITFQPPKLTTCKLLCTEIHRMVINSEPKYIILMVREAKRTNKTAHGSEKKKAVSADNDSFRFITIYDPRSATDYQCGVKQGCELYEVLKNTNPAATDDPEPDVSLEKFKQYLVKAVEEDKIILGPAITPRLVVTVWNQRGNYEEMLGSCEMSISAVLSGSGVGKSSWVTLTHTTDVGDKKDVLIGAGDVQVDLSFRKLMDIENEKQAEVDRLKRKKESQGKLAKVSSKACTLKIESPSLHQDASKAKEAEVEGGDNKKLIDSLQALEREKKELNEQLSVMEAKAVKVTQAEQESRRLLEEVTQLKKQLEERSAQSKQSGTPLAEAGKGSETAPEELRALQEEKRALQESLDSTMTDVQREKQERAHTEEALKKAELDKTALEKQLRDQAELLAQMKANLEEQTRQAAETKKSKDDKAVTAPAAVSAPAPAPDPDPASKPAPKSRKAKEIEKMKNSRDSKEPLSSMENLRLSQEKGEDPLPPIRDSNGSMIMSGSAVGAPTGGGESTGIDKGDKLNLPRSPSREVSSGAGKSSSPGRLVHWDEVPLPSGWDRRLDPVTGMIYYVDHVNKKTQWKHPMYKKK